MKPWLAHYDRDVPHSLVPYPDLTLVDYLTKLARDHADKTALLFKGSDDVLWPARCREHALSPALWSLGVRKGDRVALLLPNCPQFLIAEFGAWKIGASSWPSIPPIPSASSSRCSTRCGPDDRHADTVLRPREARAGSGRPSSASSRPSIKEYLPPFCALLFTLFKERKEGHRIHLASGDHWLGDLIRAHTGGSRDRRSQSVQDDQAVILSSGGTTGTPKGVVGLHRHYVAAGRQLYEWTKSARRPWVDVDHAAAAARSMSTPTSVSSRCAFLGPNPFSLVPNPRDIDDLLKTINRSSRLSSTACPRCTPRS